MAAAAITAFELWMLNSKTVEQYELLVRWIHDIHIRIASVDDAAAIAEIYNQGIEDRVATP